MKFVFKGIVALITVISVFFDPLLLRALDDPASQLSEVGVNPILGNKIDLDGVFTDSSGQQVKLSQVMKPGIPAVIVPVYYKCPRLCGLVLLGLVDLLSSLKLTLGTDYQVIVVSFNSAESFELAAEKKLFYSSRLADKGMESIDWRFLVGSEAPVAKLMSQLGFGYSKDGDEFAHSAAIIMLTPEGEISQYFTGVEYPAWDVRLALVEASQGKIGTALDHVMLFCFRFDQLKGKYTWATLNLLRVGAALTVVCLAALVFSFYRKERA